MNQERISKFELYFTSPPIRLSETRAYFSTFQFPNGRDYHPFLAKEKRATQTCLTLGFFLVDYRITGLASDLALEKFQRPLPQADHEERMLFASLANEIGRAHKLKSWTSDVFLDQAGKALIKKIFPVQYDGARREKKVTTVTVNVAALNHNDLVFFENGEKVLPQNLSPLRDKIFREWLRLAEITWTKKRKDDGRLANGSKRQLGAQKGANVGRLFPMPASVPLIERDDFIDGLSKLMDAESAIILVLGAPGLGKTTSSIAAARTDTAKKLFENRRYFVDCGSRSNSVASVRKVLQTIEDCHTEPKSRVLVILDNFETLWSNDLPADADRLVSEFGTKRGWVLLVTLRASQPSPALSQISTTRLPDVLTLDGTIQLFERVSEMKVWPPEVALRIYEKTGGLPLALVLFAAQARSEQDIFGPLARCENQGSSFYRTGTARSKDECLDLSLQTVLHSPLLPPHSQARRFLALIARFPAGIRGWEIKNYFSDAATGDIAILSDLALIKEVSGQGLCMLPPIREFFERSLAIVDSDVHILRDQFLKPLAEHAGRCGFAGGNTARDAIEHRAVNFEPILLASLPVIPLSDLSSLIDAYVNYARWTLIGSARPLDAAASMPCFKNLRAFLLLRAAELRIERDELEGADRNLKAALREEGSNLEILGTCHFRLSEVEYFRGNYRTANAEIDKAEELYRQMKIPHHAGLGNCHRARGLMELALRNWSAAYEHFKLAMPEYKSSNAGKGHRRGIANCFIRLADAQFELNLPKQALESFRKSVFLWKETGMTLHRFNAWLRRADWALRGGRLRDGKRILQHSRAILYGHGDQRVIGRWLFLSAKLAEASGQYPEAFHFVNECITRYETVGHITGLRDAWEYNAHLHSTRGNKTESKRCIEEAKEYAVRLKGIPKR